MRAHNRLYTLRGSDSDESNDGNAIVCILFLLQSRVVLALDDISSEVDPRAEWLTLPLPFFERRPYSNMIYIVVLQLLILQGAARMG